jgi:hypothetical protein
MAAAAGDHRQAASTMGAAMGRCLFMKIVLVGEIRRLRWTLAGVLLSQGLFIPCICRFQDRGIISAERTISSSRGDVGRSWDHYRFRSDPSL